MDDVSVMACSFHGWCSWDTPATIPTGLDVRANGSWKSLVWTGFLGGFALRIYVTGYGAEWLASNRMKAGLGPCREFAGSGVVHGVGGIIALVGAGASRPRQGKYINGKHQAIPGIMCPMVGSARRAGLRLVFVFFFVFFLGFNAVPPWAGTDLRIRTVVVNTMWRAWRRRSPRCSTLWADGTQERPTMLCNGMLGRTFVAITAPWVVDYNIAV